MLDLTKAPAGMAEYAEMVRYLSNGDLLAAVTRFCDPEDEAFPLPMLEADSDNETASWSVSVLAIDWWMFRIHVDELQRRIATWAGQLGIPNFSLARECPKCKTGSEPTVKYCAGDRCQKAAGEHIHRICRGCSYEWLEACV